MEKVLFNIFICILCVEGFTKFHSFFNPASATAAKRHYALLQNAKEESPPTPAITERILDLTQKEDIVFVIDVENVRGKTSLKMLKKFQKR